MQGNGRAVIKRMRQRQVRLNPFQAIIGQGQALEEGGTHPQRVNGGADVVAEAGQGQFGRAHPAADGFFGFQQQHPPALARQGDGGGQAVGAGTYYNRIVIRHEKIIAKSTSRGKFDIVNSKKRYFSLPYEYPLKTTNPFI